jgi:hypothetical protein
MRVFCLPLRGAAGEGASSEMEFVEFIELVEFVGLLGFVELLEFVEIAALRSQRRNESRSV